MNSVELISSFAEFAREKNIDKPSMIAVLEDVFRTMIRKKFGSDENFNVIINPESGDLEMWRTREIVDDNSEDIWDFDKIPLSEAKLIEPDFEIGEEVAELIKLEDFGRRVVQTARQTLIQKIKDIEKESLYDKYKDLVGELVSSEVYQILGRELILLDSEDNELILPKTEMIPKDRFKKGETIKAIIHKVEMANGTPRIILSRISPVFLERLFEQEIPEIYDGTITIRKIVREPGERAKVAVESYDDRIDPVGACVGMKGSRIHGIVRELQNENIDVINFTDNLELLVARTLSPAKLNSMTIDKERKRISVFLNSDQVSMAIGRGGQNIKLAGKLVGYEIDVFRDVPKDELDEEDVELNEFSDDIDAWILDELHKIGLDTAKQVLALSKEELERRTELEEETIEDILSILRAEFE
ncbi:MULTISPECIES: transcription termination factor NusA [Aquirufa]|uniref:Transcription termination/antitermination protein NusA n=2 Tax=Aquirufa TaxID=2676247 RepID=A0A2S2DXE0_9BACT|nr:MULTISPECIES: transcription termination factor NusA [Aquirufa]AWL10009.1 Transcription termination/antitermination protein NusA [Aquirufa nivalisilvae]MBZ1326315.1 transcription termination/antitermination protein NusA [Aquirufa aurantiipilula]MCZ2480637.1 transcription termination/antitermination protein NusA [Aquirufa nivalisilvae]MCZ2482875.1 transcription termination/antitermination protein NusA [Aquirufa nivalisilvae]MDF5689506.1 transcription termination factor NusA [Aquirufa aurantii